MAQPLGQPPTVPHGRGTFSFVAEQVMSDEPVAYDPCHRLTYAVDDALAPPGGDGLVEEAVRRVAAATGLLLTRRDQPDHPVSVDLLTTNYGRSPIVVDWTTPREVPHLRGGRAGLGRSVYMSDWASTQRYYVTGAVALDAPQLGAVLADPEGRALVRATIMRELSHALGLDYVQDDRELMNEELVGLTTFGPGDREGLAALGTGRCF